MQTGSEARWDGHCRRLAESFPEWPGCVRGGSAERWLDQAEIEFVSCAEWRWNEGRGILRRRLATTSIGLLYGGSGRMRLAGQELALAAPCLQIVPAGLWHDVRHDAGRPLRSIGAHLHIRLPGGGNPLELLGIPFVLTLDPEGGDAPVAEAMRQLARLDARRPPGWRLLARAELVRVIMHLVLEHGGAFRPGAPAPRSDAARLAPALALIERELARGPIPVADLAAVAGVSEVHLRTLFRRATGRAPHAYVRMRRVERACRLLHGDGADVSHVAAEVGIAEPRVFYRMFRAVTGTSPARWRSGAGQRP